MIKKLFFGLALIATAACAPVTLAPSTTIDDKLMFAAEAAYNAPAALYVASDGNGLLTPAVKSKVKPVLVQSYIALFAARCAYNFVNFGKFQSVDCPKTATTLAFFLANTAKSKALATEANAIIPKAPVQ